MPDTSILTAVGNDYGYDQIFRRQLEGRARKGDVALGITTSGNSRNVILALEAAREVGIVAAGFGGGDGMATVDVLGGIEIYGQHEIAELVRVSVRTVYDWIGRCLRERFNWLCGRCLSNTV